LKKHGTNKIKVSFNTENAKSFMVLSKDSLEALKKLEQLPEVKYGKAAADAIRNPGNEMAKYLKPERLNWNKAYFDED
jgi:hypothetical protein